MKEDGGFKIRCPECGLQLTQIQLRCPRCNRSLKELLVCNGDCKKCKTQKC